MEQLKWHEWMLPELKYLSDGTTKQRNIIIEDVANIIGLTDELRKEMISPIETRYSNRAGWALTYLKQSGLIESPKRGYFVITKLGTDFLSKNPKSLTENDLKVFEGYQSFINRNRKSSKENKSEVISEETLSPDEMLQEAENKITDSVCSEILEKVRAITPKAFEALVVDVLQTMGYGDKNDPSSGLTTGGANDGGIDGIIKQDELGLDTIYVQAKRYKDGNNVGGKEIRDFLGALVLKEGGSTKKGVFITTSEFTAEARKHGEDAKSNAKVILIDGYRLAKLMYQHNIGVSVKKTIEIKKIDLDYFED